MRAISHRLAAVAEALIPPVPAALLLAQGLAE
jgi:hypothetical protein